MIRGQKVMVTTQAAYDEYHEKHVRQWQAYYEGVSAGELGPEQEVAEGRTQAVGDPALLAELGLEEGRHVSLEQVAALGAGRNPRTGQQLVAARPGTNPATSQPWDRVAYNDLVFSVPKSVSVEFAAARAAGDDGRAQLLIHDVEESARVALERFAGLLPLARRGAGSREPMMASPVVLFNTHSTARPVRGQSVGDPQLHVHMRILNLAKGEDGRWSSVNFRVLYHNVRILNGLAESELQSRLRARGYETMPARHGDRRRWQSFELARVPQPVIDATSTRQAQVEHLAQELWDQQAEELQRRITSAREAEGLPPRALTTAEYASQKPILRQVQALSRANREDKLPLTRADLAAEWRRVLGDHGYSLQTGSRGDLRPHPAELERAVAGLAAWALGPEGLTSQRSVWTRPDLLEEVVQRGLIAGLDTAGITDVRRVIEARAIQLGTDGWSHSGSLPGIQAAVAAWTTPEMASVESELADSVARLAREGRVSVPEQTILRTLAEEASERRPLDPEQERAMRALCGRVGYAGLVGVAGAGKTNACRPAVAALEASGYQVLGLAISGGAAQVLEAETGALSWNVADFLTRVETGSLRDHDGQPVRLGQHTVLLVDEAGTVDSRTLHRLIGVFDAAGIAAIRAVGDPKQTQPVGAGGIFGWLSRQLPVAQLAVNYRQGQPEGADEAVASRLLREGRGDEYLGLKKAAGRLHVDPSLEASIVHAVDDWSADIAAGADPATHVILSDLNLVVDRANELAHDDLIAHRLLSEPCVALGGTQFAVGERVAFVMKHVERVPTPGVDGTVHGDDGGPRMVTITTPKRTRGEVVEIDLAAADGVALTVRTDERGRLPARTLRLGADEASRELAWGYAMTTAGSQGRTWDKTYAVWTGSRLAGLEPSYTAASRATRATVTYLNSDTVQAEASPERTLEQDTVERMSALISRPTAKTTTLDYAVPATRDELRAQTGPSASHPLWGSTPRTGVHARDDDRQRRNHRRLAWEHARRHAQRQSGPYVH